MSFYFDGGLTLVAACVGVVMLALLADNWFAWPFKLGWLRAIGRVSYGLYLWHFPIFYVVARYAMDLDLVPRLIVAYGMTTVFTLASWFVIERPVLRWKDRIKPRARQAQHGSSGASHSSRTGATPDEVTA